jgi:hypothetical protein
MPAANSEPSYSVTLVRFRYDIVRNEFAPLRLRKPLFNGRAGFSIEMNNGGFLARQREQRVREGILILGKEARGLFLSRVQAISS